MFRRKRDFKPDRTGSGLLGQLYITRKQRLSLLKWTLYGLSLLALSLVQDVILPGVPTDLVCCGIFLIGMLLQPEQCGIFCLLGSLFFYFSGSAPGPHAIGLLTGLGTLICIFRHGYLRKSAGSILLCAGGAMLVYELLVFALGLFLGNTTLSRMKVFLLTGLFSAAVMPLLYPAFLSIGKIGGESWKD